MATYTGDMLISDVLTSNPAAIAVFDRHGLGCAHCMGAEMETLAEIADMHDVPVDVILRDLEALDAAEETAPDE